MRNIQTSNPHKSDIIVCLGDSQTDLGAWYGVQPHDTWPSRLERNLNTYYGKSVKSKNYGVSGYTTAQILGLSSNIFSGGVTPKMVILYAGVNNVSVSETGVCPANGASNTIYTKSQASGGQTANNSWLGNTITITSGTGSGQSNTITRYYYDYTNNRGVISVKNAWVTNPDTTSNYSIAVSTQSNTQNLIQAIIKSAKYRCTGIGGNTFNSCVYSQNDLPQNGFSGCRYVVMNDSSVTGGSKAYTSAHHSTITGDYSSSPIQSVWEYRNSQSGESGWGRVAITGTAPFSDGCSNIIVISTNYLNWTSGGDNYDSHLATGSQYSYYTSVRAAQYSASSAESAYFCDLYRLQSYLIKSDGSIGYTFEGKVISPEASQGSNSWHYTANNQHHNSYGHEIVGRAALYSITNNNLL